MKPPLVVEQVRYESGVAYLIMDIKRVRVAEAYGKAEADLIVAMVNKDYAEYQSRFNYGANEE